MTLLRGTTFTGVPIARTRVGAVITSKVNTDVAKDTALVYEVITGLNADGTGGASTNAAHVHDGDGNTLHWPFAQQHFGAGQAPIPNIAVDNFNAPYTLFTSSTTTPSNRFVLLFLPFYVPAAWVSRDIGFYVNGKWSQPPRIQATLYDGSLAEVDALALDDGNAPDGARDGAAGNTQWLGATFTVSAAGKYVIELWTDVQALEELRIITDVMVLPVIAPGKRDTPKTPIPTSSGAETVTVPTWVPIDSALAGADLAQGAVTLLNAQNQNLTLELATDLVAPGGSSRTQRGHNHDGSNSPGIDYPIMGCTFGAPLMCNATYPLGNNAMAPRAEDGTLRIIGEWYLRLQSSVNNSAANSKIKMAVLVWSETSKTGYTHVLVSNYTTGGPGSAVQLRATAHGYSFLERTGGSTALDWQSGDFNRIILELTGSVALPDSSPKILGLCMWMEQ